MKRILSFLLLMAFCFFSQKVNATHIIGAEIGYTHVTGYTYDITLTIYGDCAGSAFPNLPGSIPRIEIYKSGVAFSYIDLSLTAPGVEVTPVCPSEINNTTCVSTSGTIPGVMRFIFTGTVVLDGPSPLWSFIFNGSFGGTNGAGRSFAITNINSPTTISLEATLNNVNGPNNSSIFTTIPTPFFCINNSQEYNQGAVDADGDQLSFALVPGLDASTASTVTYIPPYTYTNPLATVAGSFSFNATNGQMSFTPNLTQTSLVVNKVTETRAGVVVGTTMREMNLVVLNNCANQSPVASLPTSNVGAFNPVTKTLTICNSSPNLQFVINASDPDNQHVIVTVSGLPVGATSVTSGNGTVNPVITINWVLPQPIAPGAYTFYVNCEDDGCPLKSKQTFAYTVIITQPVTFTTVTTKETCVPGQDGTIQITAGSTFGGLTYSLDGINFQTLNTFSGLTAGTYTVTVKDNAGCSESHTAIVNTSVLPVMTVAVTPESCKPGNDGTITATASSANGAINGFSLNGGSYQISGAFANLTAGVYTVVAKDVIGCKSSSLVTVMPSVIPQITSTNSKNITCYGNHDGKIQMVVSPANLNYTYTILPNNISNTTGLFTALEKGTYTIIVKTDKECADTSFATIIEPPIFVITDILIQDATCDKNNASIEVQTNFPPPLIYSLQQAGVNNTIGFFENVAPGIYTISVRDTNNCLVDTSVLINAIPNLFTSSINHEDLQCNGFGTEGTAEVNATGGVEPYSYLWSTNPPSKDKKITNLYYGWYFVTVSDATGCETKDTVYINPGPCCESVYLPNAFSPNGDGHNDEWRIVSSTGLSIDQFAVYNRWGENVWHTYDQRKSWNGRRNDGEVSAGTYFYLLRYKCLTDGKTYIKKGDVTVLR